MVLIGDNVFSLVDWPAGQATKGSTEFARPPLVAWGLKVCYSLAFGHFRDLLIVLVRGESYGGQGDEEPLDV